MEWHGRCQNFLGHLLKHILALCSLCDLSISFLFSDHSKRIWVIRGWRRAGLAQWETLQWGWKSKNISALCAHHHHFVSNAIDMAGSVAHSIRLLHWKSPYWPVGLFCFSIDQRIQEKVQQRPKYRQECHHLESVPLLPPCNDLFFDSHICPHSLPRRILAGRKETTVQHRSQMYYSSLTTFTESSWILHQLLVVEAEWAPSWA